MSRIRSLVTPVKFDAVQRAHNCQANARHRLERGDRRMKVRNGRSWDNYCASCSQRILDSDIEKLQALRAELEAD